MIRVAPEAADVKQSCKMCLPTTYVCCVGQICWHSDTKLVVRMVRMDLCVCVCACRSHLHACLLQHYPFAYMYSTQVIRKVAALMIDCTAVFT